MKHIWKVSHGDGCFTADEIKKFEEQKIIVVDKDTRAKGTAKNAQGDDFMTRAVKGDFFYLCYGNKVRLLGKITGDPVVNQTKSDEWYERSYEPIAYSVDSLPYTNVSKWWTPNNNSTFIAIPVVEYPQFEALILKPYFNKTMNDLTRQTENKNYFWLNASPKIWSFSNIGIGQEQDYTLYNESGNKRRIFQNFLDAKVGDPVICYEANPNKKIVALGKISRASDGRNIYIEKVEQLSSPIGYAELKECAELAGMEFFTNPNGSLFRLTADEYGFIIDLIRETNPAPVKVKCEPYGKEDFEKDVYFSGGYDTLVRLLERKKNIILQGAPGVGKTYSAKRLAYSIMGEKDDGRIKLVQFHQNYSYEDFVMGYRPNGAEFELRNGVFYQFCQEALSRPNEKFFFIIDEINRGNLSRIFGELLMLIESGYRKEKVTLPYSGLLFGVPENVYIIGMMNTADRSLAMIDYALRQRFAFYEFEPAFETEGFKKYQKGLNNAKLDLLITRIKELNEAIKEDDSLGKGFVIGHRYFCGQTECTDEWLEEIVEYDILPMLSEYYFDNKPEYERWAEKLRGALR